MEGTTGEVVRLAVYWGDRLINVSQVNDTSELTAESVFGQAVGAAGVSPQQRLFSKELTGTSRVQLGALTLVAEPADAPPRVSTLSPPEDWSFFKVAVMAGMAMVAVLVSIAITPRDLPTNEDDIINKTAVVLRPTIMRTVDLKPKKPAPDLERARKPEGKAGPKDARLDTAPRDRSLVKKIKSGKALLDKIWGPMAMNPVFAPTNTAEIDQRLAGLERPGAKVADARGIGGMGSRQNGEGGGGDGDWMHIGGTGTNPNGRPNGHGLEFGTGEKQVVRPPAGPVRITDGLGKDEIMRVIKRHQSEIKFCYQSELQKNPELAGKVAVAFTIDPAGGVSDAAVAESTLENATAESCMLAKIRRWKFPEPQGGGVVAVNFPWVFSSAGTESGE